MQAIEEAGFVRWTEGERFPGSKYYVVYSPDMDRAEKEKALCDLSDEPDIRLILGLMGGLEVGHNLQACSYMYLVEPWYVAVAEDCMLCKSDCLLDFR
jgi:hypothetical protein